MFLISRRAHEDNNLVVHIGLQEVQLVLHPGEVTLHHVQVCCGHCRQVSVYLETGDRKG